MTETLALAMARFSSEMSTLEGVKTLSATLDNATDYDIVSRAVDDLAQEHNIYIGGKRWLRTNTGDYELRVSCARTDKEWFNKYEGGYKGVKYDDFRL